jgi:hypothetical protein
MNIESIARAIDPDAWADILPVPTRADTEAFHARRQRSVEQARSLFQKSAAPVQERKCNPHPDAPHGFLRNASHSENRYVCECEYWEPPAAQRHWVDLTPEEELDCYHPMRDQHIASLKTKLREKNGGAA